VNEGIFCFCFLFMIMTNYCFNNILQCKNTECALLMILFLNYFILS